MIAALFVERGGVYYGHPDIDPWDESRDARLYRGDAPVIAHPPCARWSRLAGLVEARWGYRRGDDGGCFAAALAAVNRCGGVLEHPAYTAAWKHFGLVRPPRQGGWVRSGDGWTCHVEQGRYGHVAKKATWLYAVTSAPLPELRWGATPDAQVTHLVSWCGNHTKGPPRPRVGKAAAARTPPEFLSVLRAIAAGAQSRPGDGR